MLLLSPDAVWASLTTWCTKPGFSHTRGGVCGPSLPRGLSLPVPGALLVVAPVVTDGGSPQGSGGGSPPRPVANARRSTASCSTRDSLRPHGICHAWGRRTPTPGVGGSGGRPRLSQIADGAGDGGRGGRWRRCGEEEGEGGGTRRQRRGNATVRLAAKAAAGANPAPETSEPNSFHLPSPTQCPRRGRALHLCW